MFSWISYYFTYSNIEENNPIEETQFTKDIKSKSELILKNKKIKISNNYLDSWINKNKDRIDIYLEFDELRFLFYKDLLLSSYITFPARNNVGKIYYKNKKEQFNSNFHIMENDVISKLKELRKTNTIKNNKYYICPLFKELYDLFHQDNSMNTIIKNMKVSHYKLKLKN